MLWGSIMRMPDNSARRCRKLKLQNGRDGEGLNSIRTYHGIGVEFEAKVRC